MLVPQFSPLLMMGWEDILAHLALIYSRPGDPVPVALTRAVFVWMRRHMQEENKVTIILISS